MVLFLSLQNFCHLCQVKKKNFKIEGRGPKTVRFLAEAVNAAVGSGSRGKACRERLQGAEALPNLRGAWAYLETSAAAGPPPVS